MRLAPCLQWPGSKYRVAPAIVAEMRPHRAYVEPFAGSLAVLLSKPAVPVEVINDQHELLMAFYRVLRSKRQYAELERLIRLTPYSRKELESAVDDPSLPEVERVRRFFVRVNQAYVASNGLGNWTVTYQSSSNHSNASKWVRFEERLYSVRARLEGVQMECGDAMDILSRMVKPDHEGVVYVDPPYLVRQGAVYAHDMTTVEEHEKLADMLHRVAGTGRQVLISAYDCPEYQEWYRGWGFVSLAGTKTSRPGQGSYAHAEGLWISPMPREVQRRRTLQR